MLGTRNVRLPLTNKMTPDKMNIELQLRSSKKPAIFPPISAPNKIKITFQLNFLENVFVITQSTNH